jgi:hypothetical protein
VATAGEMTSVVARALGLPQSVVTSYFAVLRKERLVTTGGRGRSAPAMSALDVARTVIALMSADALAEGAEITELVGSLAYVGTWLTGAERRFVGPEEPDEDLEIPDDAEIYEPPALSFEDALAELLEVIARRGTEPEHSPEWLPIAPDDDILVSVTATTLRARIRAGKSAAHFENYSEDVGIQYPDDWESLPDRERLIARTVTGGLSVTRSITRVELAQLALALM